MFEPSGTRVIKLQDVEAVKFVELYACERCLYDSSCKGYKDRDSRMAAANKISEAMSIPGFGPKEVLAKFKNLRSSYCQELKKITLSEKSGDVYVPKVVWFESMNSFIRPFVQQRPTNTNLMTAAYSSSPVSAEEESQQESSVDNFSEIATSRPRSPATIGTVDTGQNVKLKETIPTTSKRKNPSVTRSSKMIKTSPNVDVMLDAEEKLGEVPNRRIHEEDLYDHFGKYISSMLRIIGPPAAMRLQEQITRLVTQEMCRPYSPS